MFFKRKDGQIDKSVDIFERIMPIIMKERNDALVYMKKEVPLDGMNEYIKKKKQEGIDISHMEIIFTALARVIKEKPKLNRFIISSEIYNRNDIEISVVVKPKLEENVKESVAKFKFNGDEKIEEVSKIIKEEVTKIRNNTNNNTEDFVDKLKNIPTIVLKIAINTLMFLDKINILPKSIVEEEIDGKIKQKIIKEKYLEFGIVSDERICDRTLFFKLYEKDYEIFKKS